MSQIQPATGPLLPANADGLLKVTGYYDDEGVDPEPLTVAYFISADYARAYARQIIEAPGSGLATANIITLEGPAATAWTEYALGALAQVFDIEPGRSALDAADSCCTDEFALAAAIAHPCTDQICAQEARDE